MGQQRSLTMTELLSEQCVSKCFVKYLHAYSNEPVCILLPLMLLLPLVLLLPL